MNMNNLSAAERQQLFAATNKGGLITHLNSSVGTEATKVVLSDYAVQFVLYNTHASNSMYISFDGASSWFTLPAKSTLSLDSLTLKEFYLKADGSSTTYEILYVV